MNILTKDITILAIESSCDDTSAAVLKDRKVLSNITANQVIHEEYGGVVPELASRAHQKNIVPVVNKAIKEAKIDMKDIDAIAFTRGPGLLGSLIVGTSFAKSFALALNLPLIDVNHMEGHILAHFIKSEDIKNPPFPFLCLTVSGGHTQIVKINSPYDFELLGETIDDAAGEAFDKAAKTLGLPYPGGPLVDKAAAKGNPNKFHFPEPKIEGINFSFSGLKTSLLYFVQKEIKKDENFIKNNMDDICASYQHAIIKHLLGKIKRVLKDTGIKHLAIAGGVSANSGLRNALQELSNKQKFKLYIPKFEYCTDNAAMIGIVGYYKFLEKDFVNQNITPTARFKINTKI